MRRLFYILILAAAAAAAGLWPEGGGSASAVNGAPVIRLHVIADSDSPADQALKLKVRDAVIQVTDPVLAGVDDVEEARKRVDASLDLIKAAAEGVLAENGRPCPVRVERGNYDFPLKSYRITGGNEGEDLDLTLPAGRYEAVRVVIGSGRGANWWCVLFPPLCFVSPADRGVPAGEAGTGEKTPAEIPAFRYDQVRPEKVEAGPGLEYRLKLVEWYRQFTRG